MRTDPYDYSIGYCTGEKIDRIRAKKQKGERLSSPSQSYSQRTCERKGTRHSCKSNSWRTTVQELRYAINVSNNKEILLLTCVRKDVLSLRKLWAKGLSECLKPLFCAVVAFVHRRFVLNKSILVLFSGIYDVVYYYAPRNQHQFHQAHIVLPTKPSYWQAELDPRQTWWASLYCQKQKLSLLSRRPYTYSRCSSA